MDTVEINSLDELKETLERNYRSTIIIKNPAIASAVFIFHSQQNIPVTPIAISGPGLSAPLLISPILLPILFLLGHSVFTILDNYYITIDERKPNEEDPKYTFTYKSSGKGTSLYHPFFMNKPFIPKPKNEFKYSRFTDK